MLSPALSSIDPVGAARVCPRTDSRSRLRVPASSVSVAPSSSIATRPQPDPVLKKHVSPPSVAGLKSRLLVAASYCAPLSATSTAQLASERA